MGSGKLSSPPEHPIARLFPNMSAAEFADLRADIEAHGLISPVCLWRDQVIDGRHRLRACLELGIKPRFETVVCEEKELGALVWSRNAVRRQLSTSQKAMVAAALSEGSNAGRPKTASNEALSQPQAALLVGVSRSQVQRAREVSKEDPELAKQVKSGALTVSRAAVTIRNRAVEWPEAPPEAPPGDYANKQHRRVLDQATSSARRLVSLLEKATDNRPENLGSVTDETGLVAEARLMGVLARVCQLGTNLRVPDGPDIPVIRH